MIRMCILKYSIKEITVLKYLNKNNTVPFNFEISKLLNNNKAGNKLVHLCKILII